MKITSLIKTKDFKFLWLKKVEGIDLSKHCAQSLLGPYNKQIGPHITTINDLNLEDGIYYLCGVAFPYCYDNNFHLAFTNCDGSEINYSSNGIDVIIENAAPLPINSSYINKMLPKAKFKSYYTCRNWQFANYLHEAKVF